jgi:hypothetical protein
MEVFRIMPLPKIHFRGGLVLTLFIVTGPLLMFSKDVSEVLMIILYSVIIVASSVLIDFDHYLVSCKKMGRILTLKESYAYHDEVMKYEKKHQTRFPGDFHIFHTVEAHILVLCISMWFPIFYCVFVDMIIHSVIDFVDLYQYDRVHKREYLLCRWIKNNIKSQ